MSELTSYQTINYYGGEKTPFEMGRALGNKVGQRLVEVMDIAGWAIDRISPFA